MALGFFIIFIMVHTMLCEFVWRYQVLFIEKYIEIAFIIHVFAQYSCVLFQVLKLSQKALSETAPGELVNLLSNDVNRFDTLFCLHPLWISPLATITAAFILWREIQWAGIIGVAIIVFFTPIQSTK